MKFIEIVRPNIIFILIYRTLIIITAQNCNRIEFSKVKFLDVKFTSIKLNTYLLVKKFKAFSRDPK